jgi:hypothetical protein
MTGDDTRLHVARVTLTALCACVIASACGSSGNAASVPAKTSQKRLDPADFGPPATGANKWLPLKPGYQSVRLGKVNRGHRRLPHRSVYTVTDVSKVISGVRTVIVLDQDFDGGQIAEQALDYLAQDKRGAVWYLGSYTEAYEGGQFVNANDGWLAYVKGAKPGILMPAHPRTGTPAYTQATPPGEGPTVAKVVKTGQRRCVPFKCYKNVLVTEEGGSEYKYFAPGVGSIRTEPRDKGGEQETEELINFTHLSRRGLAEISAEALKVDKHARVTVPDVFGRSRPAKRTL